MFFAETGISLQLDFSVDVGYKMKKAYKLDLGGEDQLILVECKFALDPFHRHCRINFLQLTSFTLGSLAF